MVPTARSVAFKASMIAPRVRDSNLREISGDAITNGKREIDCGTFSWWGLHTTFSRIDESGGRRKPDHNAHLRELFTSLTAQSIWLHVVLACHTFQLIRGMTTHGAHDEALTLGPRISCSLSCVVRGESHTESTGEMDLCACLISSFNATICTSEACLRMVDCICSAAEFLRGHTMAASNTTQLRRFPTTLSV